MTQRSFEYDIRCGEQRYVSVVWRVTMISFDLLSATNPTQAVSGVTQIHKDKCSRERDSYQSTEYNRQGQGGKTRSKLRTTTRSILLFILLGRMTVHESYVRKRTISKKENNKDNRKEKIIVTISKMRMTQTLYDDLYDTYVR